MFEITPLAGCLKVMGRASAAMRICLLVLTGDNNNKNWVFVAGLYEQKHNSPTLKIGLKGCLSFRRLSNYYFALIQIPSVHPNFAEPRPWRSLSSRGCNRRAPPRPARPRPRRPVPAAVQRRRRPAGQRCRSQRSSIR